MAADTPGQGPARNDLSSAKASAAVDVSSADYSTSTPTRGLYIGGAGNIVVRMVGDSDDRTFTGVLAGQWYPLQVVAIRHSSTTATAIVALF